MFSTVSQLLLKAGPQILSPKLFSSVQPLSFQVLLFQHAITTPISVLMNSIQQLEKKQVFSSDELKKTKMAVKQLWLLSEQLYGATNKKPKCNIKKAVRNVVTLLRSKHHEIILTDISSDNKRYPVIVNEVRIQEALTCLINNALFANRNSGLPIHITCYAEKKRFRITIRDFGAGMSAILQVFAQLPLFTFKKQGKGLGLSFAKYVIETELHGSLRIFSEPLQGTMIECVIPLVV
jgi:signal transduction histidine kinase